MRFNCPKCSCAFVVDHDCPPLPAAVLNDCPHCLQAFVVYRSENEIKTAAVTRTGRKRATS